MLGWNKTPLDKALDRIKREPKLAHARGTVDNGALADAYLFLWMYSSRLNPGTASFAGQHLPKALSHALAGAIRVPLPPWPAQYHLDEVQVERSFFLALLMGDSAADRISLGLIESSIQTTSEPDLLGELKAWLALVGNDPQLAEEARQLVTSRTEDMLEIPVIYTLAVHSVLTRSGVTSAFRVLLDHYERRRGHPEGYAGFSEGGAAGVYLDYILDFRGLAIAKWAYGHGLDPGVDTKYIPRRLYTM